MDQTTQAIAAGIVRHLLTSLAGMIAAAGYMQSSETEQFVGAGMFLVGIAWSWWQKSGQAEVSAALKKLTAKSTTSAAVTAAQALPVGAAVGKALAIIAVLLMSSLLVMPAMAQSERIAGHPKSTARVPTATTSETSSATTGDPLADFMAQLEKVTQDNVAAIVADVQAADADAGVVITPEIPANGSQPEIAAVVKDPIAHACYPAIVKFLQSIPAVAAPTGKFVGVQLFQAKRDFVAQLQAGLPTYLKLGCAPLLGDEINIAMNTLALIGVRVAPAALTALMPALAPVTLPAMVLTP